MAEKDFSDYKIAWHKRLKQEQQKRHRLKMEIRCSAKRAAKFLAENFGVSKVYVFGSVLREDDFFCESSDLDLAVEGLPEGKYIQMLVSLEDEVDSPVMINVVQIETCKESLKNKILKEGKLLYAK